ncbi:MAG: hypothetical protein AAGN66_14995 [Acidobacteriota bacterium]
MLDRSSAEVQEERNSRKQPLTDEEARGLIDASQIVLVAKGRKLRELPAAEATLDDLKGPTGNYRAPILSLGDRLLVGFHADTLEGLVAG